MNEKIIKIPVYTINLRLYPNKEQKGMIDEIIHAIQKAFNITVYEMFQNQTNTIEKPDKKMKVNLCISLMLMLWQKKNIWMY